MPTLLTAVIVLVAALATALAVRAADADRHTFAIGDDAFLLDGKPFEIRCGELHFARVPRAYWRDRLRRCKAMGMNTVCAYLFWNHHEWRRGTFDWAGQADAAEFCRLAREEGLWVLLRPGPYVCAEWEMGGLPWWLLKDDDIRCRSTDPRFLEASRAWLKEVGRVLGPMQITRGGPILMVQVENEYGFYGKDANYVAAIRQALLDAGFDVPLFACNPPGALRNGLLPDLFQVVNFGKDPASGFKALREVQPKGPLMCGEFYPGWFDTWGAPHHLGESATYLKDLEYMLAHEASFSIYMAHGGTTFGTWAGADRPFKPDTSSYDYDAPVSEAGWTTEKFHRTRDLIAKYLQDGETLPEIPADNPSTGIAPFELAECAPLTANLPEPIADDAPRNMEAYDQGRGCILYRTTLPPGPATTLEAAAVHDFAWVSIDGKQVGVMDRRARRYRVSLPAREKASQLDILVEAMGRVNFGPEVHDRKGLLGPVKVGGATTGPWHVYRLPLDDAMLAGLKWEKRQGGDKVPAFWRGTFTIDKPADTFLDLSQFGKGIVWVNGRCLARYWNIGPTQTAYLPGPWLRAGSNEVVVLDLLGPEKPELAGLSKPILNQLRPELDFARGMARYGKLSLGDAKPAITATFAPGSSAQQVMFPHPAEGHQVCLETVNAHDNKPYAAVAELDLLDDAGHSIPHTAWTIAYADSEELAGEDGSATNAIDGQVANYWHTAWSGDHKPGHPHYLVIDLGTLTRVAGLRYTPRQGEGKPGRIKDYRVYVGDHLVQPPGHE